MNNTIFLIRHGESLKNTLKAYATIAGDEPLSRTGKKQAARIASALESYISVHSYEYVSLYAARDLRSLQTASAVSEMLRIPMELRDDLIARASESTSGKNEEEIYEENPAFGDAVRLYRAGLTSAYTVPWPSIETRELEQELRPFLETIYKCNNALTIVISHKSIITCLAIQLMRQYDHYPSDYYGYIDIPLGTGIEFNIDNGHTCITRHSFISKKKPSKTEVVIQDGIIRFPQSACAVCCQNESMLLVKQSRPNRETWELPGGKIELFETPVAAALRELKEETGISAKEGKLIYSLDLDLSVSFHRTHIIECSEIASVQTLDPDAKWLALSEVESMIESGEITHAPTIVAFLKMTRTEEEE